MATKAAKPKEVERVAVVVVSTVLLFLELLPDGVAYNDEDEPICFGYNCRRGCDLAKDGERCKWGWHICATKGCFAMHSMLDHGKKRGDKKGITFDK